MDQYKHLWKSATWELRAIEKALSSPLSMSLMNTPEDFDRLAAVRQILRSRAKWYKEKRRQN